MLRLTLIAARFILPVVIGLYILVVVWFLAMSGAPIELGSEFSVSAQMPPDSDNITLVESLLRAVPHLITAYALLQLWFLFGAFLHGRTFSKGATNHLTRFGLALMIATAASISLNSVFGDPWGNTGFVVHHYQIVQILIGFVFLLVAQAFASARGNAEELERYF